MENKVVDMTKVVRRVVPLVQTVLEYSGGLQLQLIDR